MSADNYLLVTRIPGKGVQVFHRFASDDQPLDPETAKPLFMTTLGPERALQWAADWCKENVCEYGVNWTDDIWDVPNQEHDPASEPEGT